MKCMWIEIKHSSSPPRLDMYRNSAVDYALFDDFVVVMTKISECNSDRVLLGDFNIDLLKSQPAWESTVSLVCSNLNAVQQE